MTNSESNIYVELELHKAKELVERCLEVKRKINELTIAQEQIEVLCNKLSLAIDIIKEFRLPNKLEE